MDFFELIKTRESCRNYARRPVEKEKLLRCIEAAGIAPSACNSQPWNFVVVTNPEKAGETAKCLQGRGMNPFTDKAPAFIVVLEEKAKLSPRVSDVLDSQHFAPLDIGLSVMQLCLAATEQGLSTCIIGWFDEEKLKDLLDIGEEEKVRVVLSVGYAAEGKLRQKTRKPLSQIHRFVE